MTDVIARRSPSRRSPSARPVPDIITELPGPKARAHIAFDESITSPSLPRAYPIVPIRGDGLTVEDIDGNLFLDFAAGIAVNSTGHSHERVVEVIAEQAADLLHFSASDFYLPIYAHAAAELARIAPMSGKVRVFLGNSGAEVVEAAFKLSRYYTRRQNVVAFLGAFHGRTLWRGLADGARRRSTTPASGRSAGRLPRALRQRWSRRARAARLQAPHATGGVRGRSSSSRSRARAATSCRMTRSCLACARSATATGSCMVADEVQSGAGRTGKMWAIEHWGVEPDILLTAKGIASGMPIAGMIAKDEIMTWGPGAHGSTYGGNPVACAALIETIRMLEGELVANAAVRGDQARAGLRAIQERHPSHGQGRPRHGPDDRRRVRLRRDVRCHPDRLLPEGAAGPGGRGGRDPPLACARSSTRNRSTSPSASSPRPWPKSRPLAAEDARG